MKLTDYAAVMNGKIGALTENSGQASTRSNVKSSNDSLHVVGCVSTYKKKEEVGHLTAYLESQRQYFEEVEEPQDETQYLRAENQKRTEEMLQKAKEELCKRKEKCNDEDTSNIKEAMVSDTKQCHQLNSLEMLHKMVWLQNQNRNNALESSHKAGDARNTASKEIVPLKREETNEYFSCMKQTKNKGRRKNRTDTLISLEDLEKPLLEAAAYQKHKHAQSHHKSASVPVQQAHVCLPPSRTKITCWQQKAGADLFPDVSTRTLTIYGAGASEDVLLKLAIEESLKTHEAENSFIDLSNTDRMGLMHTNTCNNVEIMPLPVLEPIKDESWDDDGRMGQDGSLSLQDDNSLTVAGQMQDCICSSTEHEDWEMGASQATRKVNEAAEKCGTRGRNQKRSDSLESLSSNKSFNMTTADTGQYRSQHRVEIDSYNHNGDSNHNVKCEYEENVWGPLENDEASARAQNENQCPIKKHNQIWKNPIPNPNINFGDSKASDSRIQEQVYWNQSRSHIKNQKGDHDQNLMELLPCSQRNRTVSQSYIPEASDGRTQEQIEWKLKKEQTKKQKGDHDQNLRELVQGPQRNRRESKTESYIHEASDSRTLGRVDRNQKKDKIEKQRGDHDQNLRELVQGPQRNRRESKTESYIPEASDSRTLGKVDRNQKKDKIEKQRGDHDQNLRELVQGPQRNRRESKTESYIPEASDSRTLGKVDRNQKKDKIEKQRCDRDQNLRELVQGPQRNRRESKTESYIPEASDSRTLGRDDRNQKKDKIEKQRGDHDQNLRELVQGPQRNRRESKSESYIPEASASRTLGKVDENQKKDQIEKQRGDHGQNLRGFVPKTQEKFYWNPENNLVESQKVSSFHNNVYLGVGREKSLQEIQHQECFDFRNQNLIIDRRSVYCSDEEWKTKDNELDRKKNQGECWVDSKVQRHGPVSQDACIYRSEETSLGRDEGVGMPEKRMSDHFASRISEDSGEYVHTNYDGKGVCSDEPELSYGENHNFKVPVELLNFDMSSVQDSPGTVQMSAAHIRDTHQHQIPTQFVDSPMCASQLHSVARPLFPLMNSMAGVIPSTGSSPAKMDTNMQTHAQQIANQAFQPLPATDIQNLFEAFVQEQQQRMMTMNYLVQMAIMNTTGLPNTKPDYELQAQQSNLTPVIAGLTNSPKQLPAHYNDLLLQSNNALLNPSMTPLLNPSLLSVNQIVAPRNIPLQSEASSFNREGSTLLTPNPYINMNSVGNRSLDGLPFMLDHRNQTNNPNICMNSTVSTSLNDSALHGIQTNNPLLMPSSFAIGHDHMMHLNYQSTQTQQPAAGNMQNVMQHVAPDVCNQPFGSRPTSVGTSSRMIIGKGRGRLIT